MLNTSSFQQYCSYCRRLLSSDILDTTSQVCKDCQRIFIDYNPLSNFSKALQSFSKLDCHAIVQAIKLVLSELPSSRHSLGLSRHEYQLARQVIYRYNRYQISARQVLYEPSIWKFIITYGHELQYYLHYTSDRLTNARSFSDFIIILSDLV